MAARLLISMLFFFEDTYTLKQWVKSPTRLLVGVPIGLSSSDDVLPFPVKKISVPFVVISQKRFSFVISTKVIYNYREKRLN